MKRWMTKRMTAGFVSLCVLSVSGSYAEADEDKATEILEHYCFDCHEEGTEKGGLNLSELLTEKDFDGGLMFENLVTGKMPPANKEQPSSEEKSSLLDWLAKR